MANRHIKKRRIRNAPHKYGSIGEAVTSARVNYMKHGHACSDAINAAEDYVNSHSATDTQDVEYYVRAGLLRRSETSGTLLIQLGS